MSVPSAASIGDGSAGGQLYASASPQLKLAWLNEMISFGVVRQRCLPQHAGGPPVLGSSSVPEKSTVDRSPSGTAVGPSSIMLARQIQETRVPNYASNWLQGPLRDCARSNSDDGALARQLLDGGAATEDVDGTGRRPLHWAAMRGNTSVCLALLDAGADACARDSAGKTPLHCTKDPAIVDALLDRRRRAPYSSSNLTSTEVDHIAAMANARNVFGSTALHRAAFHGREDCLMALLRGGANVSALCKSGRTALHLACRNAHAGCVEILLAWGASERAEATDGSTPWTELATAVQDHVRGDPKVARVALLLNGARATGAWGRRGWLLLMKERRNRPHADVAEREEYCREAGAARDDESGDQHGPKGLVGDDRMEMRSEQLEKWREIQERQNLADVVEGVLGLYEGGCFRHVVTYL